MRHSFIAVIFACLSTQAFAFVVEPKQEPARSKPAPHKTNSAPAKITLPPPSKATLGFYQASMNSNYDMMELYLNQGADINCRNCDQEGNTPLHRALPLYGSAYQRVRWLVEHGADVNVANANGKTPLMLSVPVSFGGIANSDDAKSQMMKLLLDHGAKANVRDIAGNTLLAYLSTVEDGRYNKNTKRAYTLILNSLVEQGVDVNSVNNLGETSLMTAANDCADYSVETLLAYKADPAIKSRLGKTALDLAIEKATRTGQNSSCNNTVKILQSARHVRQDSPMSAAPQESAYSNSAPTAPDNMGNSAYTGKYSGTFTGDDNGTFQVDVGQDGNIRLVGNSRGTNQTFTGTGKINRDGSLGISVGSVSTGATFQGSVNPKTGAMYGTWKNSGLAGNFSGNKQTQPSNPLEAIGNALDGLSKILAQ